MKDKKYELIEEFAFQEPELLEDRQILAHVNYSVFYNIFIPKFQKNQDHYRIITENKEKNMAIQKMIFFLKKHYKTQDYDFWLAEMMKRYPKFSFSEMKLYLNAVYFTLDSEQHGFNRKMEMNKETFSDLYDQYLQVFLLANPGLGKEKRFIASLAINDALHFDYYHNIKNNKDYFLKTYLESEHFKGIELFDASEMSKKLYLKFINKVPEVSRLPIPFTKLITEVMTYQFDKTDKQEELENLLGYWCYLASKMDLISPWDNYRRFDEEELARIYNRYLSSSFCINKKIENSAEIISATQNLFNGLIYMLYEEEPEKKLMYH